MKIKQYLMTIVVCNFENTEEEDIIAEIENNRYSSVKIIETKNKHEESPKDDPDNFFLNKKHTPQEIKDYFNQS